MNNIILLYNIYKFYNYSVCLYTGYQIYYYCNKTYGYVFPQKPKKLSDNTYLENISDNWLICDKPNLEEYDIIDQDHPRPHVYKKLSET